MTEEYRDILGYEELYKVSNTGKIIAKSRPTNGAVKGFTKEKFVSITDNGRGYKIVSLSKMGRRNYYVHRLVATHFLGRTDSTLEVNHKDGDKSNNHVSNLEWCTRSHNLKHAFKLGLKPITDKQREFHIRNAKALRDKAKLSIEEMSELIEAYNTGLFTYAYLADQIGLSRAQTERIIKGQRCAR